MAERAFTTTRSTWRQHRRRTGKPKGAFTSLAEAERYRVPGVEIYRCVVCRCWHLGTARGSAR